jgi:hypothetical protein
MGELDLISSKLRNLLVVRILNKNWSFSELITQRLVHYIRSGSFGL